jgi:type IV pilus assembly protein PilE
MDITAGATPVTDIIRSERTAAAGFSLVELAVTIAIASVLTTIAVPGYLQQIREARRMEARIALYDLVTREERFLSTNGTYTAIPANLGYSGEFPQVIGTGYYQVTVCVATVAPCGNSSATTGNVFLVQATPVGSQASDTQCASFSVDSTGVQSATGTSAGTCWIR